VDLLKESVEGDPVRFWEIIRDYAQTIAPNKDVERYRPYTDAEAEQFGLEEMPYGEFKHNLIRNVPLERLDWYVSGTEDFGVRLIRYLKNEKIAERVKEALKDD
jgi:hypothetical protein